jgi:hypothetical protein
MLVDMRVREVAAMQAADREDRVRQWVRDFVIRRIDGLEVGHEEAQIIEDMIQRAISQLTPPQTPRQ